MVEKQSGARTDPKALRALAHPLRWKLIDIIGREETATATRCAELTGESVANCSYHLNTLAKYGYIEAVEGGAGRERPWRMTSYDQTLSGDSHGLAGQLAAEAATDVFLDHELERAKEWTRRRSREPEQWRQGATIKGTTFAATAEEFAELTRELSEVADRFRSRVTDRGSIPDGAREVRVFIAATVTPEQPPKQPPERKQQEASP
ncbi:helix-turn-helix domain-containing protein [Catenulispora yoronensis]|uniref:Helix-turn-helix domain-containing protein n=1 Tax=Catenulispora yoronensis TaxID=450799 RepID=A0ABP5GQX8_9ACTN